MSNDDECAPILEAGDQGTILPEEFGSEMRLDERGIVHCEDQEGDRSEDRRLNEFESEEDK